ncbi:MAG: DJ-1/PfpI family protein [Deltaproteobacteria bacterium]|nr:DJ-1/PfpI family protein [Deltaproteobacteria bacterium]
MRKRWLFIFLIFILFAILTGGILAQGKRVLMVIAHNGFRDEELARPKALLEEAGYQVTIASSSLGEAKGMLGARAKPQILFKDVKVSDYEAVIFVGGIGAQEYWHDAAAHHLAQEAISQGKVLGAICIAPVILANAGVLQGKRATVWASEEGRLRKKGAKYTGKMVEVNGLIVTANGPKAAEAFGKEILRLMRR